MSGKSTGRLWIPIVLGAVVIGVLIGVIVAQGILLNRKAPVAEALREDEPEKRPVLVNEQNAEQIAEALIEEERVPVGSYEVVMNSTWRFPDGSAPSENAYVENVPENTNDVYFDVQLADTGETIYESPVIPRGTHLNQITLNRDLDAGSYDCLLIYHLIDEEQRTLRTLRMAITIIVDS